MKFFNRIFGSMNRQYMVRAYVIGVAFFVFLGLIIAGSSDGQTPVVVYVLMGINTLLFPFAKVVWDTLKGFILGDTIIVQSAIGLFVAKYLINGVLWAFALFVVPIGIIYLWIKSKPVVEASQLSD